MDKVLKFCDICRDQIDPADQSEYYIMSGNGASVGESRELEVCIHCVASIAARWISEVGMDEVDDINSKPTNARWKVRNVPD